MLGVNAAACLAPHVGCPNDSSRTISYVYAVVVAIILWYLPTCLSQPLAVQLVCSFDMSFSCCICMITRSKPLFGIGMYCVCKDDTLGMTTPWVSLTVLFPSCRLLHLSLHHCILNMSYIILSLSSRNDASVLYVTYGGMSPDNESTTPIFQLSYPFFCTSYGITLLDFPLPNLWRMAKGSPYVVSQC